jgi:glycosyltransferase involved in cell wall biosynthesis
MTVYCRERYPQPLYRSVRRVYLPTFRHKYFDTIAHTYLSTIHLLLHRQDAALYCNAANAVFTLWPRVTGIPVVLNVDGLERNRKKWNRLAKAWYLMSEWLATWCPSRVVTDAEKIAEYYRERYGKASTFIPYGAEVGEIAGTEALDNLGLERGQYFLYVSRMEPENNALLVREAFERTATELKLALIGDAPYAEEYIGHVRETSDPRVVIPGSIYGTAYHQLQSHSFAYIHATEVGGTHPALIEAMGRGALVLYLNTPENAEVAQGVGIPFEREDLQRKLEQALSLSDAEQDEYRRRAVARVLERYGWEAVTDRYEELFLELTR